MSWGTRRTIVFSSPCEIVNVLKRTPESKAALQTNRRSSRLAGDPRINTAGDGLIRRLAR